MSTIALASSSISREVTLRYTAQYIGNVQKGKNIKKPNYKDLATQEGKNKKKMVKQDTIREE